MAPPTAFDHDLLRQLVLKHPSWSTKQLSDALTADNRRRDPKAPQVSLSTIDSAISRGRRDWEQEAERTVPSRLKVYEEIAPPTGTLATEHRMHNLMRYLRDLAAAGRGDEPQTYSEKRLRVSSLNWAAQMRRDKTIVDLSPAGMPVVRAARPEELNSLGELISLAAWKIPGWRQAARV